MYFGKIEIPCGQCIGCRLEYSRQWAIRCVLEAQEYENNWFLTLTYDDDHLPESLPIFDPITGEVFDYFDSSPLNRNELTLFIKNFRRQLEYHFNHTGVRFYYCGEYGSISKRPHYHLIVFNVPSLKLRKIGQNKMGDPLYNCDFVDKIWKKGYAVIAAVNWDTCAYVARYMLKKHKGKDSDYYVNNGLVPEFSGCSRNPGIGRAFYDRKKYDIYKTDEIFVTGHRGKVLNIHPPRYYDRLYDIDDPELFESIKQARCTSAFRAEQSRSKRTSLSKEDYLLLQEGNKLNSISHLTRIL